ncbi:MAG: hypothetical protein AB7O38_29140 [Pirellulaceae bacterium]
MPRYTFLVSGLLAVVSLGGELALCASQFDRDTDKLDAILRRLELLEARLERVERAVLPRSSPIPYTFDRDGTLRRGGRPVGYWGIDHPTVPMRPSIELRSP